jgi:hypothetical protein
MHGEGCAGRVRFSCIRLCKLAFGDISSLRTIYLADYLPDANGILRPVDADDTCNILLEHGWNSCNISKLRLLIKVVVHCFNGLW